MLDLNWHHVRTVLTPGCRTQSPAIWKIGLWKMLARDLVTRYIEKGILSKPVGDINVDEMRLGANIHWPWDSIWCALWHLENPVWHSLWRLTWYLLVEPPYNNKYLPYLSVWFITITSKSTVIGLNNFCHCISAARIPKFSYQRMGDGNPILSLPFCCLQLWWQSSL